MKSLGTLVIIAVIGWLAVVTFCGPELARLINARLGPGATPPFDYAAFHRDATAAWDDFLFG